MMAGTPAPGRKILIVGDDAIVTQSLEEAIRHGGYSVAGTAPDGEDAVARSGRPAWISCM